MWLEVLSFSAVGGFATVVGTIVMAWLVSAFGVQTSVAFVANMVAAVIFNYVLRKFVIFKG
jgi:putative flippase GtrA